VSDVSGGELAAVAGAVVIALAMWVFMFRLDRRDIWPRTWLAASVLCLYVVGTSAALGEGGALVGPVTASEIGIGLAAGAAWLVATHLGAAVLGRLIPPFRRELADLYHLADGDTAARMVGPLAAMAVAEELLFRGLIQGRAGLVVAVAAYALVQLVERKWALVLAAVLCGVVWGALFAWRDGLVAPIVAHATWTLVLTLVWPIPGSAPTQQRPAVSPVGDFAQSSP
jgi:membrane protease YdiL (CAAX protease family)